MKIPPPQVGEITTPYQKRSLHGALSRRTLRWCCEGGLDGPSCFKAFGDGVFRDTALPAPLYAGHGLVVVGQRLVGGAVMRLGLLGHPADVPRPVALVVGHSVERLIIGISMGHGPGLEGLEPLVGPGLEVGGPPPFLTDTDAPGPVMGEVWACTVMASPAHAPPYLVETCHWPVLPTPPVRSSVGAISPGMV